ncbi:MerR family transcriptional regulator [Frankia sp. AiPs1]|uniref:MerR family transcriptional regulator n=1 Tax=Frankia sp. AiPs1 TaxID=573493 RepID=UPI002044C3AB|nr:MerR family transcriptional regulator [Frankia sp. AiPs1]MCM3925694.1 MerR family transcriptional regulator [Frankia sp. AiPs1]
MRGRDGAAPPRREDSFVRYVLERLRQRVQLRPEQRLPIARAAAVLGTTPRMLRYRESLGLLVPARSPGGHREYGERELLAAAYADELERRYQVSPSDLAFAVRVLAEAEVAADVRRLGQLTRRIAPSPPVAALDFEAQKGRRLLRMPGPAGAAGSGPSEPHSLNGR